MALGPRLGGYSSLKNQHGFVSFRECYTLITPDQLFPSKTNQLNTLCFNSSMFGYTQWMIPISLHFWPFDFFLHHFQTKTSNLQNNSPKTRLALKKSQKSPPCPPSTPSSFPHFFEKKPKPSDFPPSIYPTSHSPKWPPFRIKLWKALSLTPIVRYVKGAIKRRMGWSTFICSRRAVTKRLAPR